MVSIKESYVVNAPTEKVWEIISAVDNDPKYWRGLSEVRNTRKDENLVERVVRVGFMGSEGFQVIKLEPKVSIDLTMTKGPLKGTRKMKLTPSSNDGSRTNLSVEWNFEFSHIPIFARGFVKSQIERGTRDALEKIAKVAEGGTPPNQKVVLREKGAT